MSTEIKVEMNDKLIQPDRTLAPPVHPFPPVDMPEVRRLRLDNGVPLHVIDRCGSEVCRISFIRDGGMEEATRPTVATLMSDMLCEGTASYDGAALTDSLEFNGAWFNGIAYKHHTAAVMYALNNRFADVMPLLGSMATEASFPDDRFMAMRERAISNAAVRLRQVKYRSLQAIRRMVYGVSHPIARTDTPDIIAALEVEDLRRFYGAGFIDSSTGIYLSGRITPEMEDEVNRRFGTIEVSQASTLVDRRPMAPCDNRIDTVQIDGSMQGGVKIAIPTIGPSHPDYWDLSLAVTALGGYFGSRLMLNIREEKGYTYGIQSFLAGSGSEGLMTVASEADNSYVVPLIQETLAEIARLAVEPVDDEEMNRMRNYVISQAVATLDSPFNMMNYYETLRFDALPADSFRRRMDAVNNITARRIAEVAAKYMHPEDVRIAVAGDIDAYPVDENIIFH